MPELCGKGQEVLYKVKSYSAALVAGEERNRLHRLVGHKDKEPVWALGFNFHIMSSNLFDIGRITRWRIDGRV